MKSRSTELDRQAVLGEGDQACGTAPARRMESALRNDVLVAALSNSRAALTQSSPSLQNIYFPVRRGSVIKADN